MSISSLSSRRGQFNVWITCIVAWSGWLAIAQSDSADPDIIIARWNKPEGNFVFDFVNIRIFEWKSEFHVRKCVVSV